MLRITENSAAKQAKTYYSSADYYSEGQELQGIWGGKGADLLGLAGEVGKEDWDALCDNRDPQSGRVLTPRQKQNRRVGYDFNFHVPKSVSIIYGLTQDERIVDAFRDAVTATIQDIEAEMQTRVRSGGRDEDRTTGNMVWGQFIHFTSRPVGGIPDPHLHAHVFVHNVTWDFEESRWKAGQFANLKRDGNYFGALFHSRFAERMTELGFPVERTRKGWEVASVPQSALRKFSRRTALIEEHARREGIDDPEQKAELGARTREKKSSRLSMSELRAEWDARLTEDERRAIYTRQARPRAEPDLTAERAVDLALAHCFERSAVVPERVAREQALRRAYGNTSPDAVFAAFAARPLLKVTRDGQTYVTTREVLQEEQAMVDFARRGRGTCAPFASGDHRFKRKELNEGQRRAVRHVLTSPDRVMLVRGKAGVGKTYMMQEAVEAIEATGKRVYAFAPSAEASRGVLREEGFASADTVARLLVDPQLQEAVRGQVIWMDEAGLIGSRTMGKLFELADQTQARVILSGDTGQHGSIERGAALRLLEGEAGLRPVEIKEIQRQHGHYRQAVEALSDGRVADGLKQLGALGWIREVSSHERYKLLARDYLDALREGKSALVVSPTHLEGEWITSEIRDAMRSEGRLGTNTRPFEVLENADFTLGERMDENSYLPGDVVIYHQNAPGIRRGAAIVVGADELHLDHAPRFGVFHRRSMNIAPGEIIRITRNGKTKDGAHRLNNGAIFTVKGFTKDGDIELGATLSSRGERKSLRGWVVSKDYGHLDYGYVTTSYSSQGRTVDRVFIGQSSVSEAAASREQIYVAVSRGRQQAVIYTNDRGALLEAVSESQYRPTASEFVREKDRSALASGRERSNGIDPNDWSGAQIRGGDSERHYERA